MALKLITPSAALVTLPELKRHVRAADFDDDDAYLTDLAKVAQSHIDGAGGWLGRSAGAQSWEYRLDHFPRRNLTVDSRLSPVHRDRIYIPLPPLQAVDEIAYIDSDGVEQPYTTFREFGIDSEIGNGFILPAFDECWPATRCEPEAVRITFTAGFTTVPVQVKHAILLLVGEWYENREDAAEIKLSEMPKGVDALLMPIRNWG